MNIVFDLGMVLIEWDPRHLYRKVFATGQDGVVSGQCLPWRVEPGAGPRALV